MKWRRLALAIGFGVTLVAGTWGTNQVMRAQAANGKGSGQGNIKQNGQLRGTTQAQRNGARINQAAQQTGVNLNFAGVNPQTATFSPLAAGAPTLAAMAALAQPDYFGNPNWANSPLPQLDTTGAVIAGTGMRKFVDSLPTLCSAGLNDLGQCIPIANPDTTTFPGSDFYRLDVREYTQKIHADLPATQLRGYAEVDSTGAAVNSSPQYLGPMILATRDRPVRLLVKNNLQKDLFIPMDDTYMGAGMVDDGINTAVASQKREVIHLHGGNTPWISDGTPHQWLTPTGGDGQPNAVGFEKGWGFANVPDMVGPTSPLSEVQNPSLGDGYSTLYWTNQQSGRLMFFHDHVYGTTRLNVYAGMAAAYLIADPNQESALAAATVPGTIVTDPATGAITNADLAHVIPLVIQDKTFVPDDGVAGGQLAATDPTWDVATYGGKGNLWFPHVYMPNQNPADITGANAFGRWDYGPWFWPPQDPSTFVPQGQPYACTSAAYSATNPPAFPPLICPGTPNPSGTPEAFMDTPVVNGTAYPTLPVDPVAYRFQILNAANDRSFNLQLYVAEPLTIGVTGGGSGYTAAPTVNITPSNGAVATATISTGSVSAVAITNPGSGYTLAPIVNLAAPSCTPGPACVTATATATLSASGSLNGITVTNSGAGYTAAPSVTITNAAGDTTGANGAAAATITPAGVVTGVTVTSPPTTSFTTAPAIGFTNAAGDTTGSGAAAMASVNTEVKMVPAVPATAISFLPPCTSNPNTGPTGLGLAVSDLSMGPTGLQPNCWPSTWPTDGRDGGVPDPTTAGPAIIQIGTEGGLLPHTAVIPSTPVGYEYNRRSITVLNVGPHGLLVGPAERADIVIDFSAFAGKTLLLYNDSPAPIPGVDPRVDYYTGDPDLTTSGGAPSTLPGYGPNTRTIMQIQVAATAAQPNAVPFSLSTLQSAQPGIFQATQDVPIVPETAYGAAQDNYVKIQDTSLAAFIGGPIGGVTLTSGGTGYTVSPAVTIDPPTCTPGPGCVQATATAALTPTSVASLVLSTGGSGYTSAPAVSLTGGGGSGASATATLAPASVGSATVTNRGNGYTSVPTVTFSAPQTAGTTATGTAVLSNRRVTAITLTNPGSGYTVAPTITITGGGGSGATATAALSPASVQGVTLTVSGSGYTSAPAVSFSGGGGSGAAATATLTATSVASLAVTNAGNGYTSAPAVSFSAGSAAAVVAAPVNQILPKTIQELFTLDYGRMNATLGVEVPFTNFLTQTTIPYGYKDPPTEIFKDGETQVWKITHNGVDTHFIHFHLFTVQVLNRVGWDGMIKPPDPNELSWKDTVRMNPLEDIIVALRPMQQKLPWKLPNCVRPLDVTMPVGSSAPNEFTNVDPTNQPATVFNDMTNFGYEYVWHCHILGHEENDMMRAMGFAVPPDVPGTPSAAVTGSGNKQAVVLTWTDGSVNETGFTVERATAVGGPWSTVATVPSTSGPTTGTSYSYTDNVVTRRTTYFYRVTANNVVGYTAVYAAPAVGYPHTSADSSPVASNSIATN